MMNMQEELIKKIENSSISSEDKTNLIGWMKIAPDSYLAIFNQAFSSSEDVEKLNDFYKKSQGLIANKDQEGLARLVKDLRLELEQS